MSKLVLANGCFDIFHIGHVLYLEEAAKMGDELVVSVTRDKFVNKGPGRPMFNEEQRAYIVKSMRCVSRVFLCDGAIDALEQAQPDIFVKGSDYQGKIEPHHQKYCDDHKIKIRFTGTPIFSTTKIIHDRLRTG